MKGKKRMKSDQSSPSPTRELYFGPAVQVAIGKFHQADSHHERGVIYTLEILPAFNKLVENLIFIYGFSKNTDSIHELRSDCVNFLYENLHKFDGSRGTKAFSYFNVVARNWLINNAKRKTKDIIRSVSIDDVNQLSKRDRNEIMSHSIVDSPDDVMISHGLRSRIFDVLNEIDNRLTEDYEKMTLIALRTVFEKMDDIDLLNKRAIFIYVRELSCVQPKQLSIAMSQIRKHYREISKGMGGIL